MNDLHRLAAEFETLQPIFGPHPVHYRDLVADLVRRSGGSLVELGCGTGADLASIALAVPGVALTGIEADPVLMTLARSVHAIAVVETDFRTMDWLPPTGPQVVLAARALHYPARHEVAELYCGLAERLPAGSVLVNVDRFGTHAEPSEHLDRWRRWWLDAADCPALRTALARRAVVDLGSGNAMTLEEHRHLLGVAGFTPIESHAAGPHRGDAVLVAHLPASPERERSDLITPRSQCEVVATRPEHFDNFAD